MASSRRIHYPGLQGNNIGFRLALVPDPATLSLLALVGAGLLTRRRRHN